MARYVADALGKGGKLLAGGHKLQGQFFEPTVIFEAIADMLCAREETFGPFDPVFRFQKDQEAIDAANNTEFGLAIYFYSRDIGREGSSHGIKEHIAMKYFCLGDIHKQSWSKPK